MSPQQVGGRTRDTEQVLAWALGTRGCMLLEHRSEVKVCVDREAAGSQRDQLEGPREQQLT